MTISVKHAFTSAKADGADATLIRPSNWNAEHTLTLATDNLLGRSTAGTGAVEEVPCTAFGRSIIAASDFAALQAVFGGFSTGDIKPTLKTTADSGWVLCNDGTIGKASSGATYAAADAQALYELIYTNVADAYAAVSGGRTGNATNDFNAGKTLALTKMLGRALAAAGAGSGLTSRALGQTAGAETHTLSTAELASHNHYSVGTTSSGGAHTHVVGDTGQHFNTGYDGAAEGPSTYGGASGSRSLSTDSAGAHTHSWDAWSSSAGSNSAHNNMQPTTFVNFMIKL